MIKGVGARVVERLRVIERREGMGLVGEEVRLVDVGSLVMDGSGFVNGFYYCCTFDSNLTDDNGFGSVLMVMMILGA